jgi:hypothetical protein
MSTRLRDVLSWLALVLMALTFAFATERLSHDVREAPDDEMVVVMPRFMQVLMTGGDRYLAANVAVARSMRNNFNVNFTYDHFLAQARVQVDAAWFNPRHEDNYYVASAFLPWSGHVREGEEVLRLAADARPFDMLPPFFLGFDYFYFDQNPALGAQWLYVAAGRSDEQNRYSLSRIAARWAERGQDAREALRMVRMMQAEARGVALKRYLALRAQRIEGLVILQDAAQQYHATHPLPLHQVSELVQAGVLAQIPSDPLGLGYTVDAQGVPQLVQPPNRLPPPPQGAK